MSASSALAAGACGAAIVLVASSGHAEVDLPPAPPTPAPVAAAASAPRGSLGAPPTLVDAVAQGPRLRLSSWGQLNTVLVSASPARLEVPETPSEAHDGDLSGLVIFGWDRPADLPLAADVLATVTGDVGGDGRSSVFLDDTSARPRAQLYSAFVALAGKSHDAWAPYTVRVGRMTEMAEAPITYDGLTLGASTRIAGMGLLRGRIWGGIDAPQRLAQDPFSRRDAKAYTEHLVDAGRGPSVTGALAAKRRVLDADRDGLADAILNPVGGVAVEARFFGVGLHARHTVLSTVQRSVIEAHHHLWAAPTLALDVGAELRASDLVPRQAALRADLSAADGSARLGVRVSFQFLEDICAYDCTFRAFNPSQLVVPALVAAVEAARVRDQIRHLNIGPAQEHLAAHLDGEHKLPLGLVASVRGRVRRHLNDTDVDMFRTDVLEAGLGLAWAPAASPGGPQVEVGVDSLLGVIDSGRSRKDGFDLLAEGLTSSLENRAFARAALLGGRLACLAEVLVRRQDVRSRGYEGNGQWSGAVATTLRYDVVDGWALSARLDADALAPIDATDGAGYVAALVGTSLKF